jgi:hypothetical protein
MAKIIKINRTGNIFADEYLILDDFGKREERRVRSIVGIVGLINTNGRVYDLSKITGDLHIYQQYREERKRKFLGSKGNVKQSELDHLRTEIGAYSF